MQNYHKIESIIIFYDKNITLFQEFCIYTIFSEISLVLYFSLLYVCQRNQNKILTHLLKSIL